MLVICTSALKRLEGEPVEDRTGDGIGGANSPPEPGDFADAVAGVKPARYIEAVVIGLGIREQRQGSA